MLEVPATFRSFHNEELVDYADAALAINLYQQWRSQGGPSARPQQCGGYRVPLFLGGVDTVAGRHEYRAGQHPIVVLTAPPSVGS